MNQLSGSSKTPKTARGKRTRDKLLRAAEIEFGDKGFHSAAISGITHRAGVALGTFYTYYESKEEIFHDLVTYMSQRTRRWIGERVSGAPDRMAAERLGIEAYIEFAKQPPSNWVGDKNVPRFLLRQGERVPNTDWRPYVQAGGEFVVSQAALQSLFSVLSSFFNFLIQESYISANPVAQIRQKSKFLRKQQSQGKIRRPQGFWRNLPAVYVPQR